MREVQPRLLWVGHAGDGRSYRELYDLGVRAVVQLAVEESPLQPPRDLILLRFPLSDDAGNDRAVLGLAVNAVADLLRRRVPTLVCCGAGMSRSPSVAAVAISLVEGTEPDGCLRRVVGHGPADVSPAFWADVRSVVTDR